MNPTNLDQYYKSIGQSLPSVAQRQGVAAQAGIQDYRGTAAQNAQLLTYLQGNNQAPTQTPTTTQSAGTVGNNINLGNVNTNLTVPNIPTVQTRTFTPTQFTEQGLLDQRGNLERELFDIEGSLTNQNARRNELLQQSGIDMNRVNTINQQLQAAQDREIEIPIEARQDLRGRGATVTEFKQRTTPQLENAALNALALSRQSQALGNQIAQIDKQLETERQNNTLMYQQKTQRLNQIEQLYGNILSDKQKMKLELAKFANQSQEAMTKTFDANKKEFVDFYAKEGNVDAMTRVMNATDQNQLDNVVNQIGGELAQQKSNEKSRNALNIINNIDDILGMKGLSGAVGTGAGRLGLNLSGNRSNFIAAVDTFVERLTVAELERLKDKMGAVASIANSEKEREGLQASLISLGNRSKGDGIKITETQFNKVMNALKVTKMHDVIESTIGTDNYFNAGWNLKGEAEIIKKFEQVMEAKNTPTNITPNQQVLNQFLGFNTVGNGTNTVSSVQIPQTSRLAYVNNNPGNLRFSGQTGATQGQGGFAQFQTPEAGYNALLRQIDLDKSRNLTLAQFINKYAPPSENNTNQYLSQMINWLGVSANTPLSQIPTDSIGRAVALKESSTKFL